MTQKENACLVCGKPLIFYNDERMMTCEFCGGQFLSNASCEDGHYVCDECHAKKGIDVILDYCKNSPSTNPIQMAQDIMDNPYIYMHGNEHHVLVGAVLITAYHNAGGNVDLESALNEMKQRGSKYPGGACGFWGCCGAAVSAGMFLSIVNRTTPISGKTWGDANRVTASALEKIGEIGGPRCCKRNSFTTILSAVQFVKETYGIEMELPETIICHYFLNNHECIKKKCPYYHELD